VPADSRGPCESELAAAAGTHLLLARATFSLALAEPTPTVFIRTGKPCHLSPLSARMPIDIS